MIPIRVPFQTLLTPLKLENPVCARANSVQIEPAIQEEDDGPSAAAQLDESAKRSKLPAPPVQYDPKTSTTTLTKKVFAGYQQVITTKSPEGKTHTHTKTVYDPSVDEVDAPIKVATAPVVETEQKATPPPVTSTSSSPPPRAEEVPTTKSTPPRVSASPKPQMPQPQQQQVAQETMAVATHHHSLPPALSRTRSAEPVTTAAANTDEAVAPPPVPPRRKRESKVTRLGKAHQ
ncbi:hypothetical protein quinque_004636 [Culex quinquefasciatus]